MTASPESPNIVLVHCHDLGRFLGAYGHRSVRTPALDQFAADAVVFDQAFCTAPQCSPSRAALFTGRYPHSTGVMGLTQPPFDWDMNPDERHLAGHLGAAGYETVLVGIHHESRTGPDQFVAERLGFDVVRQRGRRGEDVTALARTQLRRLAGQQRPFYLQVGYLEPHRIRTRAELDDGYQGFIADYIEPDDERGVEIPGYLRDEPSARVEMAELQGAVRYMDAQVGELFRTIRELGIESETLVVFTTDHGLALPRAKCTLYDPGIETALMVRWPAAGWAGGARSPALVSNVDIVPTLLAAAGAEQPSNLHGRELSAVLDAPERVTTHRDELFAELTYHLYYDPRRCVRTDRHKLIANFSVAPTFMDGSDSRRPRTRPIESAPTFHPPLELYDLAADPWESTNLAEDPALRPVRERLVGRLRSWMRGTADPLLAGAVTPPLHAVTADSLDPATREPRS